MGWLVLSRKMGERIRIGSDVTMIVNRIKGDRVVVGFDAPKDVRIVRDELLDDGDDDRRPHDPNDPYDDIGSPVAIA